MEISIKEAIAQFLDESKLKGGIQSLQIKEIWEQLMGKTISNYTSELKIVKKTLIIETQVAPLKNELSYQKDKIIARINEHFGKNVIEEVVIR